MRIQYDTPSITHDAIVRAIPRSAIRGLRSATRPRVALTVAASRRSATPARLIRRSGDSSQCTARSS